MIDWNKASRIILMPAAILMLIPNIKISMIGLVLIVLGYFVNKFESNKKVSLQRRV
jgi:hypothetical protein